MALDLEISTGILLREFFFKALPYLFLQKISGTPLLSNLANYSFGAYLVHVLILDQLDILFGINSLSFNPLFSVPVIGVVLFIASFAISGLLHKIPVLNKYIV